MGKKFDAIYESVVSRTEAGGYLPGDFVVFKSGYRASNVYKHMPSNLKKDVDELAKCGLNIKVVQIGDQFSDESAGNQFFTAPNAVLTIAADHGGGRTYGRVVVTTDMVDIADPDQVKTPKEWVRDNKVILKPKKLEKDPNIITNVTDKGDGKNTPTDLKLAGESAKSWGYTKDISSLYEENLKKR